MKTFKTLLAFVFAVFSLSATAQFDIRDLSQWNLIIDDAKLDNVKKTMTTRNFSLSSEKSEGSKNILVFQNTEKDFLEFIYNDKKLESLASEFSCTYQDEVKMKKYLDLQGFSIVRSSKPNTDYKDLETWGKPDKPYRYYFSDAGHIYLQLIRVQIKIDPSFVISTTKANLKEMPPIQSFLNKLDGADIQLGAKTLKIINQKLTNNSYMIKYELDDESLTGENKEIDWEQFSSFYTNKLTNSIKCSFYFKKPIVHIFDNKNNSVDGFTIFIDLKDEDEFLKVVDDWVLSRQ